MINPRISRSERGVAAVEFAVILPVILIMLVLPLFLGRIMWHYTAAQKAAYDAVRYLSTVPRVEMKDPNKINSVVALAINIATSETAELNSGPYPAAVAIQCDGGPCLGYTIPATVTVIVQLYITDIFFPSISVELIGQDSNVLSANVTYAYVGI
ncbi:MAG TPA: TadE/TadG family type IV pilus assembly protein [Telluria sp.]|nr:TadE/TadG family type IV pilus assembly protein [Telluria sp.]